MVIGVHLDHLFQPEPLGDRFAHRGADEALGVHCHKVYIFRGGKLGGANQVALVFAVWVVDGDNQAACAQLLQCLLNGAVLLFHFTVHPF